MKQDNLKKPKLLIPGNIEEMPISAGMYLKSQITIGNSQMKETIFLIKERGDIVPTLMKFPCKVKHGQFRVGDVLPVVVMFRIWNTIYEIWWNYHEAGGEGAECFEDMLTQDLFRIFFVDDRKRIWEYGHRENEFREPFKRYFKTLKGIVPWSMEAFDRAKEEMYQRFPSKESLWNVLKE